MSLDKFEPAYILTYVSSLPWPPWDHVVSAIALSVFVAGIAYIHRPWFKALLMTMPVPFTCAYVISGIPIGPMHLFGFILSIGYHWLVFLLVRKSQVPLLVAIVLSAVGYVVIGSMCCGLVSRVPFAVLIVAALVVFLLGLWLYQPSSGQPHRGNAPFWVKLPTLFGSALAIYGMTGLLQGAVTTFPYAGVFASYEMRRSLRLLAGQYTINSIALATMISVMWAAQCLGLPKPGPILVGWATVVACSLTIYRMRLGMARQDHRTIAGRHLRHLQHNVSRDAATCMRERQEADRVSGTNP